MTFPLFGLTRPLAGAFPSLGAHLIMHDQEHGRAARLPGRARVTATREFDRWERWDSFHGPRPPRALRIAEDYRRHIPAQSPAWERRTCSESWGGGGRSHYFNETIDDEMMRRQGIHNRVAKRIGLASLN